MRLQESSGACRAAVICDEQISSGYGELDPPPLSMENQNVLTDVLILARMEVILLWFHCTHVRADRRASYRDLLV